MKAATKLLIALETGATGLLALAAALLTLAQALIRYSMPTNLPDWGSEVTVYCIGWAIMLSASRMVRNNMHVGVDIVVDMMPPAYARAAAVLTSILGVTVCAFIVYAGIQMVDFAIMLGERSDSSIRFPMWIYYLSIPVGFGLTAGQYAIRLVSLLLE